MEGSASARASRGSALRFQAGAGELPDISQDISGSASRNLSRTASRNGSRSASRNVSRGASRGVSRGASRGPSRNASRGASRGGARPPSSASHFSLTFAADYADFQRAAEGAAPVESALLCPVGALSADDLTSGVSEYLQECSRLDVGPRARVVQLLRAGDSTLDFSNVQLGPRGARCLAPALRRLGFARALSLAGCGLGPAGFRVAVEALVGQVGSQAAGSNGGQGSSSPLLPLLESLDLSRNLVGDRTDLVLKPGVVLPCLPAADYEFAKEQRLRLLAYQREDPRERKARLEAAKGEKEAEFSPVSTAVFGLGQRLPRPYLAPVEEKSAGKAPVIPDVVPLDSRYSLAKRVDSLGLERVSSTGRCLELLASFPALRELRLGTNRLGDEGVEHLATALPNCTALRVLGLDANQIGARGLRALLTALSTAHVETLDLSENRIDAVGAALIASFLSLPGSALRDLNLAQNPLTDQGAAMVLTALCAAPIAVPPVKKAKKADAPAGKKEQKKGDLLISEVEREEEPEFDSVEKYINYHWSTSLQRFREQYGVSDEWICVPPQGAATPIAINLESCGLGVLSSCQLVKLLGEKPKGLHLLVHNNEIPEVGFYQIMKSLSKCPDVEKFVIDWVDIDERAIKRELEEGQWEDYEAIVEKVASYGDNVVFVKAE